MLIYQLSLRFLEVTLEFSLMASLMYEVVNRTTLRQAKSSE